MSEVKVNKISPRTNCGTTTLGDSEDSFVIPSGVTITNNGTQTGFGRSGSVNWQTSIKTATFTAASGEGYFCNTSGGAFTVNLPSSPSVGDIVAIKDYGSSFATQNLTIGRGGSNMNGNAADSTRGTNNESLTLVYADATKGWLAVEEGTGFVGEAFIVASGGTVTTSGDFKIHTFTGPGTFTVNCVTGCTAKDTVSYVVVAGGGAGGGNNNANSSGGGGAGGFREVVSPSAPYTGSPLDGYPSSPNRVTITATNFPIVVGGGGAGAQNSHGASGSNSSFSTITATGGGRGGGPIPSGPDCGVGSPGGSGGGAGGGSGVAKNGGSGNTPPTTPPQGNNGGTGGGISPDHQSGAGGGAGGVGGNGTSPKGGDGGVGVPTQITGSAVSYAGGGGGTGYQGPRVGGGSPCGTGGAGSQGPPFTGNPGTTNRGGGGGAAEGYDGSPNNATGGNGGSGVVIIRYRYQ